MSHNGLSAGRGGAWAQTLGYVEGEEIMPLQSGRRAKVYKDHGLWWCHSYHIHMSGRIRRISIQEFTTHKAALRAAINAVGLLARD